MWIKIRKRTVLPIRWFFKRRKTISKLEVKTKQEIFDKLEEEQKQLLLYKRLRRNNDEYQTQGKIDALQWVLSIDK